MKVPGHLRFEETKLSPGQEWLDEAKAWRFIYVVQGAAYWLDPRRPRSFSQGELVIIPPEVKAAVRASQINEVLLAGFSFNPDLLCGFFTLTERQALENGGLQAREAARFFPSTHPLSQRLAALIELRGSRRELVERAELLGVAAAFFSDEAPPGHPRPAAELSVHERFSQIVACMPDVEMVHHTPDELAGLCGCSPRHFNRLFRQRFGQSPRSRQTELRLLRARQLLVTSDAKVTEIAADSGYRSLSLFNTLFRKRFGLSPSQWRLQASESQSADNSFQP